MSEYIFSRILPSETWALRAGVLWPEKKSGPECELVGDRKEGALHFGVKFKGEIVCVGSFVPEAHPKIGHVSFRLRAMATDADHRKMGAGRMLIQGACAELEQRGVDGIWADARHAALGFYARLDWEVSGPTYEVPLRGLHRLVWVRIGE